MEGNYSLDDLEKRTQVAVEALRDYLATHAALYVERCMRRIKLKLPTIAVCGMGRAGKDTAAEFLCSRTDMVYPKSASWLVLPVIANIASVSREQAWIERHANREFWIHACHAFRGNDYSRLVRMCLAEGDIAVGIRGRLEMEEIIRKNVVDLTVWIDNPRVPKDITVEYGPEDCDLVIPNHGSMLALYSRLEKLLKLLHGDWFTVLR